MIDLRSDTVTKPTPAMRQAMATAEVGDDVYGEDPTVRQLEELAADLAGQETALFVPSGTMANQIALGILTRPGDQVLLGTGSHCDHYEVGAGAVLNGLQFQSIGTGGFFSDQDVHTAYRTESPILSPTTVVVFENTHNQSGGRIWDWQKLTAATAAAQTHGMFLHLDGARLFNAQVATGISVSRWGKPFDTVTFCLSKGLGAPVGSVICTSKELITRAKRLRKRFGGGMRQAGIIAAAGLYALEHHVERLAEDHANAKYFAQLIGDIPGVVLEPPTVESNIIRFNLTSEVLEAATLVAKAKARGVLLNSTGKRSIRAVTHMDVTQDDCLVAAEILGEILTKIY